MKFEQVLPALREGKKVRRSFWRKDTYFYKNHQGIFIFKNGGVDEYYYHLSCLLDGDDWEIIKEKKKVKLRDLTEEQYDKWIDKRCEGECITCPFRFVSCYLRKPYSWYRNKDLFSDKFLDQEVEIEED